MVPRLLLLINEDGISALYSSETAHTNDIDRHTRKLRCPAPSCIVSDISKAHSSESLALRFVQRVKLVSLEPGSSEVSRLNLSAEQLIDLLERPALGTCQLMQEQYSRELPWSRGSKRTQKWCRIRANQRR